MAGAVGGGTGALRDTLAVMGGHAAERALIDLAVLSPRERQAPMFQLVDRLRSAAAMPPCAATVCERVGNTLVMQAVFSPASLQPTTARRPAPPAPTTTTS